jgi:hypothetical protein
MIGFSKSTINYLTYVDSGSVCHSIEDIRITSVSFQMFKKFKGLRHGSGQDNKLLNHILHGITKLTQ